MSHIEINVIFILIKVNITVKYILVQEGPKDLITDLLTRLLLSPGRWTNLYQIYYKYNNVNNNRTISKSVFIEINTFIVSNKNKQKFVFPKLYNPFK